MTPITHGKRTPSTPVRLPPSKAPHHFLRCLSHLSVLMEACQRVCLSLHGLSSPVDLSKGESYPPLVTLCADEAIMITDINSITHTN